jgi:hypothetical protein
MMDYIALKVILCVYSVAWGQATFWRGGNVTPGWWAS